LARCALRLPTTRETVKPAEVCHGLLHALTSTSILKQLVTKYDTWLFSDLIG
jgi:hypothetical protein